jgi:hypothetical protein
MEVGEEGGRAVIGNRNRAHGGDEVGGPGVYIRLVGFFGSEPVGRAAA